MIGLGVPFGATSPSQTEMSSKSGKPAEVVKVLTDPAVKEKSEQTGNYPVTSTPDEFSAFIRKEARRGEKVIKESGIKFD